MSTQRFARLARLVGPSGVKQLADSFVVVVGLGGVGSWAVEALARSGVGRLRLVDFDAVCITNTNRQLPALADTVGRAKAEVLAARVLRINPDARVEALTLAYDEDTVDVVLGDGPDYVVDAIDNFTAKCHLIATCRDRGLPLVTSMGAGGRMDPTRVKVADLNLTVHDKMAAQVRRILREKHGFPKGTGRGRGGIKTPWGIDAVFTDERCQPPIEPADAPPLTDEARLHRRAPANGTVSFVTGTFGLVAASVVVRALSGQNTQQST